MGHSEYDPAAKDRRPWNVGRIVGAKRELKPQQVWAIRFWLDREPQVRDRAMFDFAIDSKLRGCDVVKVKIGDLVSGGRVRSRAIVIQQKTGRPVQFELVGGEILVKRRSESETDHGNVAAKRDDQARQEQLRMRRRIARASYHRASGGRDRRCNSPRIPSAWAPGPPRSRKIPDQGTHAGPFRSAVRRTDARPERTEPT